MCRESSVDKARDELCHWGQADPVGLANYAFEVQSEVR